jgi:TatD DNase family protein
MLYNSHSHFYDINHFTIVNKSDDNDYEDAYYSIGIHPWNAEEIEDNFFRVEHLAINKRCLAIGEIGLDKLKGPEITIQKRVFERQILLSEKLKLPVILHCVKSWNDISSIKQCLKPTQIWVFHGFNKVGILNEVLKNGLMISIGASILSNLKLQNALKKIPNNRLLLETDDTNIDIYSIYEKVSEIKKIPLSELEMIIEENFNRIFRNGKVA